MEWRIIVILSLIYVHEPKTGRTAGVQCTTPDYAYTEKRRKNYHEEVVINKDNYAKLSAVNMRKKNKWNHQAGAEDKRQRYPRSDRLYLNNILDNLASSSLKSNYQILLERFDKVDNRAFNKNLLNIYNITKCEDVEDQDEEVDEDIKYKMKQLQQQMQKQNIENNRQQQETDNSRQRKIIEYSQQGKQIDVEQAKHEDDSSQRKHFKNSRQGKYAENSGQHRQIANTVQGTNISQRKQKHNNDQQEKKMDELKIEQRKLINKNEEKDQIETFQQGELYDMDEQTKQSDTHSRHNQTRDGNLQIETIPKKENYVCLNNDHQRFEKFERNREKPTQIHFNMQKPINKPKSEQVINVNSGQNNFNKTELKAENGENLVSQKKMFTNKIHQKNAKNKNETIKHLEGVSSPANNRNRFTLPKFYKNLHQLYPAVWNNGLETRHVLEKVDRRTTNGPTMDSFLRVINETSDPREQREPLFLPLDPNSHVDLLSSIYNAAQNNPIKPEPTFLNKCIVDKVITDKNENPFINAMLDKIEKNNEHNYGILLISKNVKGTFKPKIKYNNATNIDEETNNTVQRLNTKTITTISAETTPNKLDHLTPQNILNFSLKPRTKRCCSLTNPNPSASTKSRTNQTRSTNTLTNQNILNLVLTTDNTSYCFLMPENRIKKKRSENLFIQNITNRTSLRNDQNKITNSQTKPNRTSRDSLQINKITNLSPNKNWVNKLKTINLTKLMRIIRRCEERPMRRPGGCTARIRTEDAGKDIEKEFQQNCMHQQREFQSQVDILTTPTFPHIKLNKDLSQDTGTIDRDATFRVAPSNDHLKELPKRKTDKNAEHEIKQALLSLEFPHGRNQFLHCINSSDKRMTRAIQCSFKMDGSDTRDREKLKRVDLKIENNNSDESCTVKETCIEMILTKIHDKGDNEGKCGEKNGTCHDKDSCKDNNEYCTEKNDKSTDQSYNCIHRKSKCTENNKYIDNSETDNKNNYYEYKNITYNNAIENRELTQFQPPTHQISQCKDVYTQHFEFGINNDNPSTTDKDKNIKSVTPLNNSSVIKLQGVDGQRDLVRDNSDLNSSLSVQHTDNNTDRCQFRKLTTEKPVGQEFHQPWEPSIKDKYNTYLRKYRINKFHKETKETDSSSTPNILNDKFKFWANKSGIENETRKNSTVNYNSTAQKQVPSQRLKSDVLKECQRLKSNISNILRYIEHLPNTHFIADTVDDNSTSSSARVLNNRLNFFKNFKNNCSAKNRFDGKITSKFYDDVDKRGMINNRSDGTIQIYHDNPATNESNTKKKYQNHTKQFQNNLINKKINHSICLPNTKNNSINRPTNHSIFPNNYNPKQKFREIDSVLEFLRKSQEKSINLQLNNYKQTNKNGDNGLKNANVSKINLKTDHRFPNYSKTQNYSDQMNNLYNLNDEIHTVFGCGNNFDNFKRNRIRIREGTLNEETMKFINCLTKKNKSIQNMCLNNRTTTIDKNCTAFDKISDSFENSVSKITPPFIADILQSIVSTEDKQLRVKRDNGTNTTPSTTTTKADIVSLRLNNTNILTKNTSKLKKINKNRISKIKKMNSNGLDVSLKMKENRDEANMELVTFKSMDQFKEELAPGSNEQVIKSRSNNRKKKSRKLKTITPQQILYESTTELNDFTVKVKSKKKNVKLDWDLKQDDEDCSNYTSDEAHNQQLGLTSNNKSKTYNVIAVVDNNDPISIVMGRNMKPEVNTLKIDLFHTNPKEHELLNTSQKKLNSKRIETVLTTIFKSTGKTNDFDETQNRECSQNNNGKEKRQREERKERKLLSKKMCNKNNGRHKPRGCNTSVLEVIVNTNEKMEDKHKNKRPEQTEEDEDMSNVILLDNESQNPEEWILHEKRISKVTTEQHHKQQDREDHKQPYMTVSTATHEIPTKKVHKDTKVNWILKPRRKCHKTIKKTPLRHGVVFLTPSLSMKDKYNEGKSNEDNDSETKRHFVIKTNEIEPQITDTKEDDQLKSFYASVMSESVSDGKVPETRFVDNCNGLTSENRSINHYKPPFKNISCLLTKTRNYTNKKDSHFLISQDELTPDYYDEGSSKDKKTPHNNGATEKYNKLLDHLDKWGLRSDSDWEFCKCGHDKRKEQTKEESTLHHPLKSDISADDKTGMKKPSLIKSIQRCALNKDNNKDSKSLNLDSQEPWDELDDIMNKERNIQENIQRRIHDKYQGLDIIGYEHQGIEETKPCRKKQKHVYRKHNIIVEQQNQNSEEEEKIKKILDNIISRYRDNKTQPTNSEDNKFKKLTKINFKRKGCNKNQHKSTMSLEIGSKNTFTKEDDENKIAYKNVGKHSGQGRKHKSGTIDISSEDIKPIDERRHLNRRRKSFDHSLNGTHGLVTMVGSRGPLSYPLKIHLLSNPTEKKPMLDFKRKSSNKNNKVTNSKSNNENKETRTNNLARRDDDDYDENDDEQEDEEDYDNETEEKKQRMQDNGENTEISKVQILNSNTNKPLTYPNQLSNNLGKTYVEDSQRHLMTCSNVTTFDEQTESGHKKDNTISCHRTTKTFRTQNNHLSNDRTKQGLLETGDSNPTVVLPLSFNTSTLLRLIGIKEIDPNKKDDENEKIEIEDTCDDRPKPQEHSKFNSRYFVTFDSQRPNYVKIKNISSVPIEDVIHYFTKPEKTSLDGCNRKSVLKDTVSTSKSLINPSIRKVEKLNLWLRKPLAYNTSHQVTRITTTLCQVRAKNLKNSTNPIKQYIVQVDPYITQSKHLNPDDSDFINSVKEIVWKTLADGFKTPKKTDLVK